MVPLLLCHLNGVTRSTPIGAYGANPASQAMCRMPGIVRGAHLLDTERDPVQKVHARSSMHTSRAMAKRQLQVTIRGKNLIFLSSPLACTLASILLKTATDFCVLRRYLHR